MPVKPVQRASLFYQSSSLILMVLPTPSFMKPFKLTWVHYKCASKPPFFTIPYWGVKSYLSYICLYTGSQLVWGSFVFRDMRLGNCAFSGLALHVSLAAVTHESCLGRNCLSQVPKSHRMTTNDWL